MTFSLGYPSEQHHTQGLQVDRYPISERFES